MTLVAFVFQVNKSAKLHCFSRRNCQHESLECFVNEIFAYGKPRARLVFIS